MIWRMKKMKYQLNKIFKITFITLFFLISKSYAIENVSEFTDAINEAREEFNEITEATTEQSKIIDEAIKEIDKATEYVQEAINNQNAEDAIKTLEFIERSLTDVGNIIPQEFSSDMSNIDTAAMSKEDMDVINELTAQMNVSKEEKLNEFMSDLVELNQKGIDTISISKNLDSLGIDTVKVVLDIKEGQNLGAWTKEEWAESYQGNLLTSSGSEVIADNEINNKVVGLEQKLQANNVAILEKRTSLTELQTKIDPLNNQITDLKTQKSNILAQYNEEILKQSSTILSDGEIAQSKELADQFNNQLNDLTTQIKAAEQQSSSLQQQVQNLNLELSNEIASKTQLQNNIRELNNQLSANQNVISQKTSEINKLKNTNLNTKINSLNEQLQYASRERDFIQTDFERSIDLEVEAVKRYYSALGSTEEEIDFAMREVNVVLDSDPRKARAFEIEKYATYAGLSKEQIQNGIDAVNNDDWDTQKDIFKEITSALSKNPDWEVDIPSTAELNVMIEEEKAIQEAVFISMELEQVKQQVQNSISEKTKDLQPLVNLNPTTIRYAAVWDGMPEKDFINQEYEKIVNNSDLKDKISALEVASNSYREYMDTDWNSAANKGQYDFTKAINLQNDYFKLSNEVSQIQINAQTTARENLVKLVEDAKAQYESITNQESKTLDQLKAKISQTLKEVPTFEQDSESVVDLDPAMLRAKLYDISSGSNNEVKALNAARDAVAKIGEAPVSEYMTGPTWQMTNVKAAAIVRSKKYDYVDDYAYITAEYQDPLNLNSSQREELENELKSILGKDNLKLQTLNTKVSQLSNELNLTQEQSQKLTAEISQLENELSSLKSSENQIQNQISELSNQFSSKESLIAEKTQNLSSLQAQLNPLSEKMSELQSQRTEIDTKLNSQLDAIANQIDSQGVATDEANALKTQFENQIAELDNQIKDYESQSVEINSQLSSLTVELNTLETETPEIANQIESLNQDLKNFKEIKADLAMATAKKLGLDVDEDAIQSVEIVDGKAIVSIKGTDVFRVVDQADLIEQAAEFTDPISQLSRNQKIFTANALNPELITPEFIEASKNISGLEKLEVLSQTSAVQAVGATTEQSAKFASAKAARLAARKDWDAALASGDKAAAAAAEAAFMTARDIEQVAGQEAVAAAAAASAAAQEAAQSVASVAQEASAAAQEAAAEVQDVVASAQSAQQAALDALYELEALPGATGFHTQEVTAAIKQLEAEMNGTEFNYLGQSSYEDAMKEIERMESTGKSVVECLSQEGC